MQYDLSAKFVKSRISVRNFQEIWTRMCQEFLLALFPASSIVRMNPKEYGIDLLDQTTGTAYFFHVANEPNGNTLSIDDAMTAIKQAALHRHQLEWKRYNISTNAEYSEEGINFINEQMQTFGIKPDEVGFLGPATWNRLCSEYPHIVEKWFNYQITVSKDEVKKAFEKARYYPNYVAQYATQIEQDDYKIVLTNNRTPLKFIIPFSPKLTVEHLLEVGKILMDLSLEETDFRDLGSSAQLSLSVVVNDILQDFSRHLSDIPVRSGGEAQIWIKIIWQEKSFDRLVLTESQSFESILHKKKYDSSTFLFHSMAFYVELSSYKIDKIMDAILGHSAPHHAAPSTQTANIEEQTLARKVALVSAHIWQNAKNLFSTEQKVHGASESDDRIPVRLGASAPKAVAPGSSFIARFVAYHPDLEIDLMEQLNKWNPKAMHQLDCARSNWRLGTQVKVKVYGEDLVSDPEEDTFCWGGEKHILDFRVKVDKNATSVRDLKFDVYIENLRISRIWMPLEITQESKNEQQSRTLSSPSTAFASYASEDRLRVLDRVATLEIHCGLQVFLDCVSMRPNVKWRELIPEMVIESDQLLLFWSKAARDSSWVDQEWRLAFKNKGIDGIEIHPLSPYEEAKLPQELANLVHSGDPLMAIRSYEEHTRSELNTQKKSKLKTREKRP